MTFSQEQLKQIIHYDAKRLYFGNWNSESLDELYHVTKKYNQTSSLHVGDLTNDIICNTLWYEMSYNPFRFGITSPFKALINDDNDIIYFNDTYRKKLQLLTRQFLPDDIINLTWNISNFIENLHKSDLYDSFVKTGKLPAQFDIQGSNHGYRLLSSLRKAIHAIAAQNWKDLKDPEYKEHIVQVIQQRHPNGHRSDVNYMLVAMINNMNKEQKIKGSPESVANIKKFRQEIETNQKTKQSQKIIQTAFPFDMEKDDLQIVSQKINNTESEIAIIEDQIKDFKLNYESVDTKPLEKKLKLLRAYLAGLYNAKKILDAKRELFQNYQYQ